MCSGDNISVVPCLLKGSHCNRNVRAEQLRHICIDVRTQHKHWNTKRNQLLHVIRILSVVYNWFNILFRYCYYILRIIILNMTYCEISFKFLEICKLCRWLARKWWKINQLSSVLIKEKRELAVHDWLPGSFQWERTYLTQ